VCRKNFQTSRAALLFAVLVWLGPFVWSVSCRCFTVACDRYEELVILEIRLCAVIELQVGLFFPVFLFFFFSSQTALRD
jgi:hypothetical protein